MNFGLVFVLFFSKYFENSKFLFYFETITLTCKNIKFKKWLLWS